MWSWSRTHLVCAVALTGCGAHVEAPVDCDGAGPTKLLSFDSDDGPSLTMALNRAGSRRWVFRPGLWGPGVAVQCDRVPREFASELSGIWPPLEPGLPWIAESPSPEPHGRAIYRAVDPWGDGEPIDLLARPIAIHDGKLLIASKEHYGEQVRLLLVSLSEGSAPREEAVMYRLPSSDDRIVGWPYRSQIPERTDRVYVQVELGESEQRATAEIQLPRGETTLLRVGLVPHSVRAGGRFVVLEPTDPGGQSLLLDRAGDREVKLGEPGWKLDRGLSQDTSVAWAWGPDGPDGGPEGTHLVFLPDLDELWLEGQWSTDQFLVSEDGDRVLDGPGGTYLLRAGSSEPVQLAEARGWGSILGDSVYVWDHGPGYRPLRVETWEWRGIVRVPLGGGDPEVLVEGPVSSAIPLEDGRWATTRVFDGHSADLVLVDPRTGVESVVAHEVRYLGGATDDWFLRDLWGMRTVAAPRDEILYVAPDEDSAGLALWRLPL